MSERNLLVPGTSGTKLVLNGEDIGWPLELMAQGWSTGHATISHLFERVGIGRTPEEIVQLLSMEYADASSWLPTKTTLVPGAELKAGNILELAYTQFKDFVPFPYDWRSDIRHSAELLLARLQEAPGAPWKIVAHSQGCLVVVIAAQRFAEEHHGDDRAFAGLVSHVALVAPPLFGTLTAVDAIANGENLGAAFKSSFQGIARTWPALHQMLPSWLGSARVRSGPNQTKVAKFNMQAAEAWTDQDVSPGMLRRAQVTSAQYLSDPFGMMNGVKKRVFLSRAWPTWNAAIVGAGAIELTGGTEPGDSLVPDDTTVAFCGDNALPLFHSFGNPGQKDTMVHFMLANDPVVATDVKDFFRR